METTNSETLQTALNRYFAENGFTKESYEGRWMKLRLGPLPICFPNSAGRKRALLYHDLHHVLTGYRTDWLGEAEIGAWELASGCKDFGAAWLYNALAVGVGFVQGPARVAAAFRRGLASRNLYGQTIDARLLARSLTEARAWAFPNPGN